MDTRRLPYGPGKTAPRWINDLLDYDTRYRKKSGKNLLADPAPQYKGIPLRRKGPFECRHDLTRKDGQSNVPPLDEEVPNSNSQYVVAAYCPKCRHHFRISVNFSPWGLGQTPCHLADVTNPMHHLRLVELYYSEDQEEDTNEKKYDAIIEGQRFVCSGSDCPVMVEIKILPPRLDFRFLDSLLNTATVFARGKAEIEADPDRLAGEKPVSTATAYGYLGAYLQDAKALKVNKIAMRNKKYRLAFADDCHSLFEYLGFAQEDGPTESDEEPHRFWRLPVITETNREFIDDIYMELCFLHDDRPPSEHSIPNRLHHRPISALKDLQRSLGCFDYPRKSRSIDLEKEEHPYYASLGVVEDFTDELLSWAYDRQCYVDPDHKPYYLDCLEDLATGRKSSDLQTKVVMATSAGEYGLKAIEDAYNFFRLNPNKWEGDDHAIGVYKSRIESAPRQKDEARNCLLIIAKHRGSQKIEAQANDRTMSFEEALEFLNVTTDTASDSIEASAIAMALDADKGKVARALRVISNQRNGDYTLQKIAAKIESGTESALDVAEAYRRLQITSTSTSDENVLAYFNSLSNNAPSGSKDSYAEALRVIALDRDSKFLLRKIDDPNADVQASTAEPIGLDNIGNTCYLNSLLQYYYTVKPIRDMVMDYQNHRMELNEDDIKKKKVGGRRVEKAEIVKATKFVDELHNLFLNLKTAPTRSVKPTRELAELTIFSSEAVKTFRTNSISSPQGPPNIAEIMGRPVYGPHLPSSPPLPPAVLQNIPQSANEDMEMVDRPNNTGVEHRDDSSEATLVDELPSYSEIETEGDNAQPPKDEKVLKNQDPEINVVELEGDSVMVNGINSNVESDTSPVAPEKPPPIPPRNKSALIIQTNDSKEIPSEDELWKFGSQQDVTEVIGNVMFRLQCAIKPTSFEEESGEQIDIVRTTFFGTNTVYTQKAQSLDKKVEAWPTIIVFPAKDMTRDIYEALDVVYDEQMVEIDSTTVPQYSSISKLPPILQIQIQRTDFDLQNQRAWKNRHAVTFPETLYLDRYVDSNDPESVVMRRRRETWRWKKQLQTLEARHTALKNTAAEINVPDALIATKDFIRSLQEQEIDGLEIDPALPEALEERIAEVATELENISGQIETLKKQLLSQFTDMREYEYKLHAVFIHRGEAGGGHYWIYIYDHEHNIWREYNDDRVEEVRDRRRIFNSDQSVLDGTPYYLVYVRSADMRTFVDPVSRDVREAQVIDVTEEVWVDQIQEDISMANGDDDGTPDVRHVEHTKPRPLRPKPTVQSGVGGWEAAPVSHVDANGKPW